MSAEHALTEHKVTVLLVDDQPIVGETVRRMLLGESDIVFHYCKDATKAVERAVEIKPTVIPPGSRDARDRRPHAGQTLPRERIGRARLPMIVLSTKEDPKVKAEAFGLGANDYIVKLPDRLELLARIRYHSKGYINLLQRNEAYRALQASQRILAKDVSQAAKYVYSLLPEKLKKGEIRADWRFIPSAELGGDSFGYEWLDDDHFAFYLLDVSGHGGRPGLALGLGPERLAFEVAPPGRLQGPRPGLDRLESALPDGSAERLFFTIWYGIFHKPTRRLDYSGGGHPPSLLLTGPTRESATQIALESEGPMVAPCPTSNSPPQPVRSTPSASCRSTATASSRSNAPTARPGPSASSSEYMSQVDRTPDDPGWTSSSATSGP